MNRLIFIIVFILFIIPSSLATMKTYTLDGAFIEIENGNEFQDGSTINGYTSAAEFRLCSKRCVGLGTADIRYSYNNDKFTIIIPKETSFSVSIDDAYYTIDSQQGGTFVIDTSQDRVELHNAGLKIADTIYISSQEALLSLKTLIVLKGAADIEINDKKKDGYARQDIYARLASDSAANIDEDRLFISGNSQTTVATPTATLDLLTGFIGSSGELRIGRGNFQGDISGKDFSGDIIPKQDLFIKDLNNVVFIPNTPHILDGLGSIYSQSLSINTNQKLYNYCVNDMNTCLNNEQMVKPLQDSFLQTNQQVGKEMGLRVAQSMFKNIFSKAESAATNLEGAVRQGPNGDISYDAQDRLWLIPRNVGEGLKAYSEGEIPLLNLKKGYLSITRSDDGPIAVGPQFEFRNIQVGITYDSQGKFAAIARTRTPWKGLSANAAYKHAGVSSQQPGSEFKFAIFGTL